MLILLHLMGITTNSLFLAQDYEITTVAEKYIKKMSFVYVVED